MSTSSAANLLPLLDYWVGRQNLLPSRGSLQWYVRTHRPELVKAGALLMVGGRYIVDPGKFDAYIVAAGAKAAAGAPGA